MSDSAKDTPLNLPLSGSGETPSVSPSRSLKDYRPQHDHDCQIRFCQRPTNAGYVCGFSASNDRHEFGHDFIAGVCTCGLDQLLAASVAVSPSIEQAKEEHARAIAQHRQAKVGPELAESGLQLAATLNRLIAAVRASAPSPSWKTIESAPKDGKLFGDLWCVAPGRAWRFTNAHWSERKQRWCSYGDVSVSVDEATHWMPLPAPPGADTKEPESSLVRSPTQGHDLLNGSEPASSPLPSPVQRIIEKGKHAWETARGPLGRSETAVIAAAREMALIIKEQLQDDDGKMIAHGDKITPAGMGDHAAIQSVMCRVDTLLAALNEPEKP